MPSRKCARPAPDPAAGHPWPALGIPLLHPRQARTILSVGRKKRWDGSAARCGNAITLHRRPDRIDCSETPQVLGWYLDFAACDLRLVAPRRPNFAPPRHRDPCKLAAPSGLAFHPEAHARRSPSCVKGVCAQPAMDGRQPALGAWTRIEPGEHTPCVQDGLRDPPARPPWTAQHNSASDKARKHHAATPAQPYAPQRSAQDRRLSAPRRPPSAPRPLHVRRATRWFRPACAGSTRAHGSRGIHAAASPDARYHPSP